MLFKFLVAALPLALAAPSCPAPKPRAPVVTPSEGQVIPNRYIVKLKEDATEKCLEDAIKFLGDDGPKHVYGFGSYRGFAAYMDDNTLNAITGLTGIDYVEKDCIMSINSGLERRDAVTQPSAPWGLARISHVQGGSTSYVYDESAGEGTCVYVLDTGVFTAHTDFEGRAEFLVNYVPNEDDADRHGHGTHVAGTVGSKTYGVAKKTKIFGVKVFDSTGEGANSQVIAGINYAANDRKTGNRPECAKGSLANLSLGGGKSDAVNAAAANAVKDGLFMAVASGNAGVDASTWSPASESTVYTVGATDANDKVAWFSNYGRFVDILAPGVDILSTWNNGGTNTMSGTSMACPHVAGLAAYLLALEGQKSVTELSNRLTELATKNIITGLNSNTVNALAFNGYGANQGGNSTQPPSPTGTSHPPQGTGSYSSTPVSSGTSLPTSIPTNVPYPTVAYPVPEPSSSAPVPSDPSSGYPTPGYPASGYPSYGYGSYRVR